jgi:hypothetical protein
MLERRKLGEILVELRVLTPAEVERVLWALRRRGDQAKFGQVAREMGLLREEHILAALAVQMELFPGIQDLSLNRLLGSLENPAPAKSSRWPGLSLRRRPSRAAGKSTTHGS